MNHILPSAAALSNLYFRTIMFEKCYLGHQLCLKVCVFLTTNLHRSAINFLTSQGCLIDLAGRPRPPSASNYQNRHLQGRLISLTRTILGFIYIHFHYFVMFCLHWYHIHQNVSFVCHNWTANQFNFGELYQKCILCVRFVFVQGLVRGNRFKPKEYVL